MEAINTASLLSPSSGAATANSFSDLGSDDFLKLLIMQLRNQDPLEPVDNAEMLRQISSIRDIELSTSLTESLQTLTGQQRFASASSLIGQYVTGVPDEGGASASGLVVGVRFTESGQPILQLSNGTEMPVDQVSTIEPPLRVAEALVGRPIVGLDRRDPADPKVVEGIVTAARVDAHGEVLIEIDTGEDLRLADYVRVTPAETT